MAKAPDDPTPEPGEGAEMDTPYGRMRVPAATGRLHGTDRSGLGEKGWAEDPEPRIAHPDDTNVEPDFYQPQPRDPEDRDL